MLNTGYRFLLRSAPGKIPPNPPFPKEGTRLLANSGKSCPASSIQNILIFSFSHIGDAVLSTVVIPPLREYFPDTRIHVLVGPVAQEVFRGDARINDVIVYDNRGVHAGLSGKSRLVKELKGKQFDLVIDLRDSFWARFVGGVRWGTSLSQRLAAGYKNSHAVGRYLDILRLRGVESGDAAPEFYLSDSEKQVAADFLSRNGVTESDVLIGIHPGGGWPYKLWPVERFAALGDLLNQNYGAKILIFAGPDEASLRDQMLNEMKSPPILAQDTGLRETAALIQRCQLYIGNDTGPMHISAAVGTRAIAIFGPTNARRSGPYGDEHIVIAEKIHCSPCHPGRKPGGCKRGSCLAMEAVSLEQVAETVERILTNG